ncbi:hypothetical protein ACLB2K_001929 [Fragaria x ananassa]
MFLENPSSEHLVLPEFPGGAETFELLVSEDALTQQATYFLEQDEFYKNWETCAAVLLSCQHPKVLEYAKTCEILPTCVRTIKSTSKRYFRKRQVFEASSSSQVEVDDVDNEEKKRFLEQLAVLLPKNAWSGLSLGFILIPDLHEVAPEAVYTLDITTFQHIVSFYLHKHEDVSTIANLVDDYLNKNAANDVVSVAQFQGLADSVRHARSVDDNLYFAIDMYLQTHPSLAEWEKEKICQSLNCQNLTSEVQNHATKRRVLSLRAIVELYSLNNQELKHEVQENKRRISALENTVDNLSKEVEKLGSGKSKGWTSLSKKLGFNKNLQVCTTSQDAVHNPNPMRRENLDSSEQ